MCTVKRLTCRFEAAMLTYVGSFVQSMIGMEIWRVLGKSICSTTVDHFRRRTVLRAAQAPQPRARFAHLRPLFACEFPVRKLGACFSETAFLTRLHSRQSSPIRANFGQRPRGTASYPGSRATKLHEVCARQIKIKGSLILAEEMGSRHRTTTPNATEPEPP